MSTSNPNQTPENQTILIGNVMADGEPVADVAVKFQDRPTYISGPDGKFEYLAPAQGFTIEKIERPGYELLSPTLPFTTDGNESPVTILMKRNESPARQRLREKAEAIYEQVLDYEIKDQLKLAASLLTIRADLDPDNVRWQYETGKFLHKYKDYRNAQSYYNRAIKKAEELYGEKNQWLAICYEAYGDNYFKWNVYFESGIGDENNTLHFADAKTYYQQAGHFWYTLLGEQNDHVALIYWKMGHCWNNLDNGTNALTCYEKAYNVLRSVHGEYSRQVENIYSAIINFHFGRREYDKALEVFQKLLPITKSIEGESSDEYKQLLQQVDYLRNELARQTDSGQ